MMIETIKSLAGSKARLWGFTPSHDRLTLQMEKEGGQKKFLICLFCEQIDLEVFANWNTPTVEKTEDGFLVIQAEGAKICCKEYLLSDEDPT